MPEISATYHPNAAYMRFRQTTFRGRTQPEDSIWYRSTVDVPPLEHSDDIMNWCYNSWSRPFLSAGGDGWRQHDYRADNFSNTNIGSMGYYLDGPPVVPSKKKVEINNPLGWRSTETTTKPFLGLSAFYFNGYWPPTNERRVQGGHANNPVPFLPPTPVGGVPPDNHYTAIWPAQRVYVESISTYFNVLNPSQVTVGSYTQRSFDSNEWAYFYNGDKSQDKWSVAGSNGSRTPAPPLIVTYDELERGWINHIMMLSVDSFTGGMPLNGSALGRWPAPQADGEDEFAVGSFEAGGPYGGHVFRLKRGFDIDEFVANEVDPKRRQHKKVFLRGLRDYGAILMDKHGSTHVNLRPVELQRPCRVLVANDPGFDYIDGEPFEFGEASRASYDPFTALSDDDPNNPALYFHPDNIEVLDLSAYQVIRPGEPRARTYPATFSYFPDTVPATPVLNQGHWQSIQPG